MRLRLRRSPVVSLTFERLELAVLLVEAVVPHEFVVVLTRGLIGPIVVGQRLRELGLVSFLRFRSAADRTKSLTFSPLDLSRITASTPFQVEVLTDRVVQQTHGDKPYSEANTFAVCGVALTV
jgi:hypothetical protein